MLLGTEGAFCVSIDCYNTAWSKHLDLQIRVMRHRIESSKYGSSEQCVIATVEGDDVEDLFFASEYIQESEDHF